MAESLNGKRAANNQNLLPGYRSDSLIIGSDYHYDPFCEVCFASKNQNVEHDGFCKDCVQFLCEDCLRVHRTLHGTQGHLIQRGDDMPKSMADKPPKFDNCHDHHQTRKDQFCCQHRVLLCSKCVSLQHKDCRVKHVEYACKYVTVLEIDALYDKVSDFQINLSSVVAQIDNNIANLGKEQVDLLKDVQDLKDKVIANIEKLYQETTSEIKSTYKANTADLGLHQNELKGVITDLKGTLDDIDKLKGKTVDIKVFLKIQDMLKNVEQCKSTTEKLRQSSMTIKISPNQDKRILEFLSDSFKVGLISLETFQDQVPITIPEILFPVCCLTKLCSYNIKLNDDKRDCRITGMTFTYDGRLLLADFSNNKIKLFYRDMQLLCSLSLSSKPWDIAVIGDKEAVVNCDNEEKLLILDI